MLYHSRAGYRGHPGYWRQGYGFGHGIWWAWRYPWALTLVPFATWYVWPRWIPYYTVDQRYVAVDGAVPAEAIVVDRVNFPDTLPALPTFAELQIDLGPLRLQRSEAELSPEEQALARQTIAKIGVRLAALRRSVVAPPGYAIVPDMDLARYTWIRQAV